MIEPPSHKLKIWFIIKYMPIIKLNFLHFKTIAGYKKVFLKLCNASLRFNNYDLVIYPEDFNHCCYEYNEIGEYKSKFSRRRAKRILLIQQICNKEIPYEIIVEKSRRKKTIVIISELAEFCFVALPISSGHKKYFRLITMIAFGKKVESGLRKIIHAGEKIELKDLKGLFEKEKGS